jgi:hypothetical protein
MSASFEAAGAPVEQGRAQGEAQRAAIRAEAARLRGALPWLARRALVRRVAATSARALATQLPWQRERIEGIAHAARVDESLLLIGEALTRVEAAPFADGAFLQAVFEPPDARARLQVRRSAPDAGGFASVEVVLAPLAGCLAGVNTEGIAALCLRDQARDELSLRFLAQELLFRARDLAAGIDHLRRRAGYAGGSGVLLVADASRAVRRLRFRRGVLEENADASGLAAARTPQVELDPRARRLRLAGETGWHEATR